ncbi:hypothetical protein PF001_g27112 [Phytophthora fragariae]|nr:hypothetical protein PF009_g27879 [Phytophthora fragariae]KAE8970446.1 hypothetical protein PF011_g26416 [Phytophthora fragariae]KAE9274319.1 hypothetical protein PF001_g27112 [Phytophthora fragariae]
METELGVSSKSRDTNGRLVYPFLQTALKYPRYTVDDPRTSSGTAFTDSCMPKGNAFYGANQDADGKTRGEVNGTLVLDVGDWDTHWLASLVVAILAEEVVGYKVSISVGGESSDVTQRMSSAKTGVCTPTHVNTEVWTSSSLSALKVYSNKSYLAGGIGDAAIPSGLLDALQMMTTGFDKGYFQAVLSNIEIPAYFCFIGYGGVTKYASDVAASGDPVLFYHYEPDLFHVMHKGKFDRVFLPHRDPERVKLSTGNYGEHGYGGKTDNPVDVDYPSLPLSKFAALLVKDSPIGSLISNILLSDLDINDLLGKYNNASSANEPEPYFSAACNWVKTNYNTWSDWMGRLPLCTFEDHIIDHVTGCENGSTVREIQFAWKSPNPGNTTLPNNCDGGVDVLPETIETSRTCDWIFENRRIWSGWIDTKPSCDSTFYDYNVSECDSDAHRTVTYFWKLPYVSNAQYSSECSGGETLPEDVVIYCEYMPTSSPTFAALTVLALIVVVLLVVAIIVVFKQRDAPIIRRSQYEMLLLMIFGGFFTTGAAIAYAGRPSRFLCGVRPVLICMGFTTIFGALVIKSLRVYRVFMRSAMKRVKVTLFRILKILSIFYVGDIVIFVAWYGADFPEPTITTEEATEFRGTVDRTSCSSSSFIFTALLIFWKAILLMLGLYLSFLIRNVSVDFQESPWIFGSVVVVLVGCLVIMPMTYLVTMRASTYYVFLALALIICTILIMCLMLVPKLFRLNEVATSSVSGTSTANSMMSRNSMVQSKLNGANLTNLTNASANEANGLNEAIRKSSQKYQVKPLGINSTIADEATSTTNY